MPSIRLTYHEAERHSIKLCGYAREPYLHEDKRVSAHCALTGNPCGKVEAVCTECNRYIKKFGIKDRKKAKDKTQRIQILDLEANVGTELTDLRIGMTAPQGTEVQIDIILEDPKE